MTQTVDSPATGVTDTRLDDDVVGAATDITDETPAVAAAPSARAWRRRGPRLQGPHVVVASVVAFNLWFLRAERLVIAYPNDSAFHAQMVSAATRMLLHGQNPLASWFPSLSLGSPLFVQYQSASAILTGTVGMVVGSLQAYAWSLYLLLALWPICVYLTGRLLGWGRWESAVAAAVAPFLFSVGGRGFEIRAYAWIGSGLWSQLWAMWSLPLAIGFGWRYIAQRRYLFGAVAAFAATIAFHYLLAYLAALVLVALVLLRPSDLPRRLARAALVGGAALLATLWVTVPLLADARYTSINEFQVGTPVDNSYGARTVLGWLVTGRLFDSGRLPVITLLAAIGLGVCIARCRRDERARVLLAVLGLSLALYIGRPTLGFLLDRLPGSEELLFQRFVTGVQLAGVLLAGVGAVAAVRALAGVARQRVPALAAAMAQPARWRIAGLVVAVATLAVYLAPAWTQARDYAAINADWYQVQQVEDGTQGHDVSDLLALAERLGGGRVYAGLASNWGSEFDVGGVPIYNYAEGTGADMVAGTLRTFSLMSDPAAWFDQDNPGDYAALGVRYILVPSAIRPRLDAIPVARRGAFALWSVESGGYVHVVDTQGTIAANGTNLGARTRAFLAGARVADGVYPTIAYDGLPAAAATLPPGAHPSGPAGTVRSEQMELASGRAVATVDATRRAVVLLSVSYDPGWTVTVDGHRAATEMVAPALLGVTVGPGTHRVVFTYHGYGSYPMLFAVALTTLVGVAAGPLLWRRLRRRSAAAPDPAA